MTELEEWKQVASGEAGLRREFQEKREKLRTALVEIVMQPSIPDAVRDLANKALDADRWAKSTLNLKGANGWMASADQFSACEHLSRAIFRRS